MSQKTEAAYIAFAGEHRVGSGDLREVARAVREAVDRHKDASILVFDAATSSPIEIDRTSARVAEDDDRSGRWPAGVLQRQGDLGKGPGDEAPLALEGGKARNHLGCLYVGSINTRVLLAGQYYPGKLFPARDPAFAL